MSTVVTGHRMAFATSGTRTVLWDQIKYTGNPTEFSWVLPIKGNVKLEQSTDAWFEALDTVTNGRVSPPQLNCFYRSGGGSGCACGGASSDSASRGAAFGTGGTGGPISGSGVIVTHEGSIGPYAYVQVAGGGQALADWLPMNGYAVPQDIAPMLAAYAQEGFGFIALKLQPGQQIKQMTPVRVITEGGVATLPLRMVAAGTGDFVAITLYVIAEGRYEVDGFGAASIDTSKLSWDWANSQSNYADVRKQALTAGSGKVWLTGFSQLQGFTKTHFDALSQQVLFSIDTSATGVGSGIPSPGTFTNLTDLYFAQAESNAAQMDSCSTAGISARLGTSSMVYDDCKGMTAVADGGVPPASGTCPPPPAGALAASQLVCKGYSDIAAAMIGMHPDTVWLTRLEANLPRASLAADLKIKPSNPQDPVSNAFRAAIHVNPPCDLLENHPEVTLVRRGSQQAGIGLMSGVGLFFARRFRRRRS